jgi:hypothetical protein
MPISYGTDRVFRDMKICELCGRSHTEMEFKRMRSTDDDYDGVRTHRGRCPVLRTWLYIRID